MRKVGIRKPSVDETCIVVCAHSVEEIVSRLSAFHRIFFRTVQLIKTQKHRFVEIHYSQVVEAAKDVEVDVVFHEFELWVE